MHDLMGEDEYGDEEEGYGEEDDIPSSKKGGPKKKVQEQEYDFMWNAGSH